MRCELGIRVLNLNNIGKAVVFNEKGDVIAASMDDIEISIVPAYYERNKKFMNAEEELYQAVNFVKFV